MTDVTSAVKAPVTSDQALREQRLQIYCKETKDGAPCTPGEITQALDIANANEVPTMNNRDHNFSTLVKQNFYVEPDPSALYYNFSWPLQGIIYTKALQQYSKTPYGAMFIKKILLDNSKKGVPRFFIRRDDDDGASGSTTYLTFPLDFPLITKLQTGEVIDVMAIIHHETGHTRYSQGHAQDRAPTMQDERIAVIHKENPVRMYNKHEPRYAYFSPSLNQTINIITGEVASGVWMFDKTDPRKLIKAK